MISQIGGNPSKRYLKCPFHDDKSPSAEIKQSKSTQAWYFKCHSCGIADDYFALKARIDGKNVGDILKEETMQTDYKKAPPAPFKAQGKIYSTFNDLMKDWKSKYPNNKVEEINPYTDGKNNKPFFVTVRYRKPNEDKKQFFQASKDEFGWSQKGLSGKTPLFNLEQVSKAKNILIVEGEKCVRVFTELGFDDFAATTSAGGAQNADKADWSPCAGKVCYIMRDFDENGEKYQNAVIEHLKNLSPPCAVYRVRVEDLGLSEKGDLVDYLETVDGTNAEKRASVQLCLQDAESLHKTSALEKRIAQIKSGEFRNIPFLQMPLLSDLSKALMPGTVTTICGEPGAGKSFFMLEQFWRWSLEQTARVKLMMLEDDDAFHQNRALAQISGCADLSDIDFCNDNIEFYEKVFSDYKEPLEYFSRHLYCVNSRQLKLSEVADWVIEEAYSGTEIIGADVLTAAETGDKGFLEDKKYMFRVKEALEKTGARLIQVTHPRIGQAGKPGLSGMSGGAAYPRFSHTVLWLRKFDTVQTANIYGLNYNPSVSFHHQIDIGKARNGKGGGKSIISKLNGANLCTEEIGIRLDA